MKVVIHTVRGKAHYLIFNNDAEVEEYKRFASIVYANSTIEVHDAESQLPCGCVGCVAPSAEENLKRHEMAGLYFNRKQGLYHVRCSCDWYGAGADNEQGALSQFIQHRINEASRLEKERKGNEIL